jgi:hypothetical protein
MCDMGDVLIVECIVGLEIMHLFVCDLLGWGSAAQIIFETKTKEEFKHSIVVTPMAKKLAWVALICINLFFVYFSIMRGMTREYGWQKGYAVACAIQLVVEILLYESSEVLWIHYVIPQLVSNDVSYILKHLQHTVDVAFSDNPEKVEALDMSTYFFVSTKVAEKFSHLFESVIVLSYHSRMPPEGSRVGLKWKHIVDAEVAEQVRDIENECIYRFSVLIRRFSVLVLLGNLLKQLGTVPMRVQQLILHTLQPLLMSFVLIGIRYIAQHGVISGYVGAVLVLELVVYEVGYYARKRYNKMKDEAEQKKWLAEQEQAKEAAKAVAASTSIAKKQKPNHSKTGQGAGEVLSIQGGSELRLKAFDEEKEDAFSASRKLQVDPVELQDFSSDSSEDDNFQRMLKGGRVVVDISSSSDEEGTTAKPGAPDMYDKLSSDDDEKARSRGNCGRKVGGNEYDLPVSDESSDDGIIVIRRPAPAAL